MGLRRRKCPPLLPSEKEEGGCEQGVSLASPPEASCWPGASRGSRAPGSGRVASGQAGHRGDEGGALRGGGQGSAGREGGYSLRFCRHGHARATQGSGDDHGE